MKELSAHLLVDESGNLYHRGLLNELWSVELYTDNSYISKDKRVLFVYNNNNEMIAMLDNTRILLADFN